jgi:hypothetical protein
VLGFIEAEEGSVEVTFTRTEGGCETVIRRDDGRVFRVPAPSKPRPVPHDLAHFAVEQELGWQTGFWGYVARGAVFAGMQQLGGRRPPHADERSRAVLAAANDRLAEAEVLTRTVLEIVASDREDDPREIARIVAESWWPPGSYAERLPQADLRRACAAVRRTAAAWEALGVGESLTFAWSRRRGERAPENASAATLPKRRRSSFVRKAVRR